MQALCDDRDRPRRCRRKSSGRGPRSIRRSSTSLPNPAKRARIGDLELLPRLRPLALLASPQVPPRRAGQHLRDQLDKPAIDELLAAQGIAAAARAEELPVEKLIDLAEATRTRQSNHRAP